MKKHITLSILIAAGLVLTACNDENGAAKELSQSIQKDQAVASAAQAQEEEQRETQTTKKLLGGAEVYYEAKPQGDAGVHHEATSQGAKKEKGGKFGLPPR